ncbi:group II intron maturase-specific domain-containing protein [Flavobacterium polysaccharolyticum]|uniref:group II intron maturase-specific domain-containing protein n=1 Tax=Flavobacterium polysaccharolyticum TaxID=3133148 RepID=UPI003CCC1167
MQRGWLNYFRGTSIMGKLLDLDGWLRNRLRYCIWHDWKKPERKRKNLIRLGIDQDHAYAFSRTRKGGWAIAQSPILSTTITLKRLKQRGYQSLTDVYIELNPSLCEPPSTACSESLRDDPYARWCTQVFIVFLVFVNVNI